MTKLNIPKLIGDLGGASAVAKMCGVVRTAPYGWIRRKHLSSKVLERLKTENPELQIDNYFTTE
jgi:hypothetical protein